MWNRTSLCKRKWWSIQRVWRLARLLCSQGCLAWTLASKCSIQPNMGRPTFSGPSVEAPWPRFSVVLWQLSGTRAKVFWIKEAQQSCYLTLSYDCCLVFLIILDEMISWYYDLKYSGGCNDLNCIINLIALIINRTNKENEFMTGPF